MRPVLNFDARIAMRPQPPLNASRVVCMALFASVGAAAPVAAHAQDPWAGWHMALIASNSRLAVSGETLRGDGSVGSNASQESSNFHDKAPGLGLLLGVRQRWAGGWVVGVESDLAWLGHRSSHDTPIQSGVYAGQPSAVIRHDTNWLATLRLTAGWQVGRALLYGTGGLAVTHDEVRRTQHRANPSTLTTDPVFTESDRSTRVGHVVGAGAHWHLGGAWSVRAEYLHARLPRSTAYFPDARGGAQASYSSVQGRIAERQSTMNTLRVGLARTFHGW